MKAFNDYTPEPESYAHKFNELWQKKKMDESFNLIDKESDGNIVVSWLKEFDNPFSSQLAEAGHEETLDLIIDLQDDFLAKLTGTHGDYQNDTPPLIKRLIAFYGKKGTENLLTGLLHKV